MNQRPTIREQMDACRPDRDDLHLPEHAADLAELHGSLRENGEVRSECERIQKNDRLIRSAMQDISLPAGLEAKLLAAVQAAQAVPLAGVEQAVREDAPASGNHLAVPVPAKASRRWFMKTAIGLGAAAASIVAIFVFLNQKPTDQQITKDQLASQVEEWLRTVDARTMNPPTKAALTTFPTGAVLGKVDRFRSISGGITAYSVTRGASRATLLVVPTTKSYEVGSLPFTKLGISGGWQVGAWQKGGVLYVIAVPENSDARLDQFAPQQPIG